MNYSYAEADGKPVLVKPAHVNLGLAIDMQKKDGTRQLLVPSIKRADTLDFAGFWAAYENLVRRARGGQLTVEDFADTTISLTNPGTIGTVHSVPRLMKGQGTTSVSVRWSIPPSSKVLPRDTRADGRLEGHDVDQYVRPPDHPGRAER